MKRASPIFLILIISLLVFADTASANTASPAGTGFFGMTKISSTSVPRGSTLQDSPWWETIDQPNGYGYFVGRTGTVWKVHLSDLIITATLDLSRFSPMYSSVIDTVGGYLYIGAVASYIVKVRLSNLSYVANITVTGYQGIGSGASLIDKPNGYLYFGAWTPGGFTSQIIKVQISSFTEVANLTLNSGDNEINCGIIDQPNQYAYFGTDAYGAAASIIKVNLSTFTRVGSLTLFTFEEELSGAAIDQPNGYGYFAGCGYPGTIIKVHLSDLTRVAAIYLPQVADHMQTAVIDEVNGFAYFSNVPNYSLYAEFIPGVVVQVNLHNFNVGSTYTFSGLNGKECAYGLVIDTVNQILYAGTLDTTSSTSELVKIQISMLSPPIQYPQIVGSKYVYIGSQAGEILWGPITVGYSGLSISIGIDVLSPVGSIRMALYDHSGNLISQSPSVTAVAGWDDLSLPGIQLVAGYTYNMSIQLSSDACQVYQTGSNFGGYMLYNTMTYGSFPSTLPYGYVESGVYELHMRLTYSVITVTDPIAQYDTQGGAYAVVNGMNGKILSETFVPTQSGSSIAVGVNINNAAGSVRVAIYSVGGSLLGQSASVPVTYYWEFVPVTGAAIVAGSTYYVSIQFSNSSCTIVQNDAAHGGSTWYSSYSYGSFPSTLPACSSGNVIGFYGFNICLEYSSNPFLVVVTATVTYNPTMTQLTTMTKVVTSLSAGAQATSQFNLYSALLLMIIPFVCFTFIGYEASGEGSISGVPLGAVIGAGVGVIINVYLGNFPIWTIILIIIGLVAAIFAGQRLR